MRLRRFIHPGDLRLTVAVVATVGFAILLNQPSKSADSIWIDSTVLRLNLPADVTTNGDSSFTHSTPRLDVRSFGDSITSTMPSRVNEGTVDFREVQTLASSLNLNSLQRDR